MCAVKKRVLYARLLPPLQLIIATVFPTLATGPKSNAALEEPK